MHDDSTEIFKAIEEWFQQAGVKNYQDYNHLPVRGRSSDATLGGGYQVLKYFGNLRGTSGGGVAGTGCASVFLAIGACVWWITYQVLG